MLFKRCSRHRDLHPFPTRRSSDLRPHCSEGLGDAQTSSRYIGTSRCSVSVSMCATTSTYGSSPEPSSLDRKSTRLNSSHVRISYAVFCLKKKNITRRVRHHVHEVG